MTDFFPQKHIRVSNQRRFGLCDLPGSGESPAYLSETDGKDWIAVVHNDKQEEISFVPIDHCIELLKDDGSMDHRCDCCIFHHSTIIFVELKQRKTKGNEWINDGEMQLRATISHFEREGQSRAFKIKKAYIANSCKPHFRSSQKWRMDKFLEETGYLLRIESHIKNL